MSQPILLLLSTLACSSGLFGGGKDPELDTAIEADADADADTDSDTDADSDSDTDADADTDVDPDKIDDDGDGYTEDDGDCDDTSADVSPDALEVPYDGIDNDCNPDTADDDIDGDGYDADEDCDDTEADIYPGAEEDYTDGVDNDCDGQTDERFDLESADSTCDCGYTSAVGVDSLNNVHVAYTDGDTGYLMYKERSGTTWSSSTTVDDYAYFAGLYIDAKVDKKDRFQVAYSFDDWSGENSVAFSYMESSGTWYSSYVVNDYAQSGSTDLGNFVGLAVDSGNLPSFIYQDQDGVYDPDLFGSGGFAVPVVDSYLDLALASLSLRGAVDYTTSAFGYGYDNGWFADITIDSNDNLHTAWFDQGTEILSGGGVRYYKPSSILSAELAETIYTGTVGGLSIALKSDDTPCLALYTTDSNDVEYGCMGSDGGFTWSTIDSAGSVGQGVQLAFNSSDEPYIVYYNETSGALRMSHHDGSAWSSFQVDGAGDDVGQYPSIAIDSSDTVHVTYYDVTNGALLYAYGR
ncbi:MAG: putative metal-binding motif-containing protein [Myxococcota bacterium]|nr:putative metal-binding motif-containing protein [Myxococcota bacterium]